VSQSTVMKKTLSITKTKHGWLDVMQFVEGIEGYRDLRARAVDRELPGVSRRVWFAGRDDLIAMKRATGRPQDLVDVDRLESGRKANPKNLRFIAAGESSDVPADAARWGSISRLIWHNMVMARRQTLIQLDDARIAALDQRAAASGRSRSDLIREAVDLLLGTGDEAAIDAAIVAGYKRDPAPDQDPWTLRGALAAIRAEPW
jgi:hypothetical protein